MTNTAAASGSGAGANSSPSSASLARIEPYLLLAKSARGAAAARIIHEATAAPGCYVFAELADTPAVKDLSADTATHGKTLALLELFMYGTLADYQDRPDAYPPLSPAHLAKLRQLTLVTLASQSRMLSYRHLVDALQLSSDVAGSSSSTPNDTLAPTMIRKLEDAIIEAMYSGLVAGKLDQKKLRFHVDSVMGRDVAGQEELKGMEEQLREWDETTSNLLDTLSQRIAQAKSQAAGEAQARGEHDRRLADVFQAYMAEQQDKAHQASNMAGAAAGSYGRGGGAEGGAMDLDAVASGKKSRAKRTRT